MQFAGYSTSRAVDRLQARDAARRWVSGLLRLHSPSPRYKATEILQLYAFPFSSLDDITFDLDPEYQYQLPQYQSHHIRKGIQTFPSGAISIANLPSLSLLSVSAPALSSVIAASP